MKRVLIVLAVLLSTLAAQDKPKTEVPVLTAKEQLDLRNLQVEHLQAQAALQATPQYQAAMQAAQKLSAAVQAMKVAHKVDDSKVVLCDGPGQIAGPCSDVKVGELVFKELPVQQAKK